MTVCMPSNENVTRVYAFKLQEKKSVDAKASKKVCLRLCPRARVRACQRVWWEIIWEKGIPH